MTRVAHVMRTYGVHGGERQLGQLFSSFSNPAFRHIFCFVYRDDSCATYFRTIAHLELLTLLSLRSRAFPSLVLELALLFLCLPVLQIRLLIALKRNDCRICVAHGLQGGMVTWLAAMLMSDVRFVYVHRGTKSTLGKLPVFKLLYWPFDKIAGVSQASADSLKGLVTPHKLMVLENGIDWQDIDRKRLTCEAKKEGSLVISCVGRLLPGKGQRLLLQAFAQLQKTCPASELWIVGDGPDGAKLKRFTEELGIAPKVKFLGHSSQVICLLAQSDVFAYASESEGLSNAVLEAMAVGLPSVVVDAPGVSECHVHGVTGFMVKRSAEELAEKFALLAKDGTLRKTMGEQAQQRVREHYSIEANCQRYAALYQQLAG